MFNTTEKNILKKVIFLSFLCLVVDGAVAAAASQRGIVKEGNRLYQQGEYAESEEKYQAALEKDPESEIVNFNLGTALYKEESYDEAIDHFQKVLLSEDEALKKRAYYNMGNALYQSGVGREDEDVSVSISSLEKAVGQYERALEIDEEDEDAKHNLAFVQKELQRLMEKQQQQQQQPSDESQDQEQQDQEQQGQEQQEQDQQSQDGQEGQEQQQEKSQQQEQGGDQEGQQGQEQESQDGQEKSDEERGQSGEEDYNKQQEEGSQPQSAEELTQKEAQMLLESYQQSEEPQGLLNIYPKTMDTRPVLKDW